MIFTSPNVETPSRCRQSLQASAPFGSMKAVEQRRPDRHRSAEHIATLQTNDEGAQKRTATERRLRFVEEYLQNGGNATRAAVAAGFSPATAYSSGGRLLKHVEVSALIRRRRDELATRYQLTTEAVVRSVAQAVFFDPRRLFDPDGRLKKLCDLDVDTAMGLTSFELKADLSGGSQPSIAIKRVKWLNKNTARDQAAKILGLYGRDHEQGFDPMSGRHPP